MIQINILNHVQFNIKDMQQEFIVPEKSPNDQRQYQALELSNKIKIVFVHDPKAEKAACSISVGVGSLMDGQRSLGLAHFLQHMLFMGSQKFPKFNEYSEFISLNSGYDNAYTSDNQTNYRFEIATAKFIEGTQRICDFFVKALLTSTCIQKQRQAVHQEYMLWCSNDNTRKWQILKQFASGPYHNHSIGNNGTLSHQKVQEDLRSFYENQYSSNRITAALLSSLPISQMKQKLIPFFNQIENKNLKEIQYETHFHKQNIGKFVHMQSIKDQVLMEFFWVVDSLKPYYKHHPDNYISHVIGHEGKNSLLSLLKQRDWANQISSYSHDLPKQSLIGLQLHLTELGEKNYQKVYNLVTDYVANLKPESFIYEQLSQTSAVSFKYKEKMDNSSYVTQLSEYMHQKPLSELLTWKSRYAEYDELIIDKFLKQLVPQNVIVVYSCSEQLQNGITQKYLGAKYQVKDLPQRKVICKEFQSITKNPFLPMSTQTLQQSSLVPQKQGNLWFVEGDFNVCKGGIHIKICKPQSQIFLQFYSNYLDLLLKELTYQAECLKLNIEFNADNQFVIEIFGFSHTVQKLVEEIAPIISNAHKGAQGSKLFKLALQNLKEEYQNFYNDEVDEIVEELTLISIKSTGTTIEERQQELESYKLKKISHQIEQFWKTCQIQWIVVGNFNRERIRQITQLFQKAIGNDNSSQKMKIECIKLKKDNPMITVTHLQSEDIATSAVIKYNQVGQYTQLKYYILSILKNYISTPFFDKLRTQMQLAYHLAAYQRNIRGVLSLWFLLISSTTNPFDVSAHISTFIKNFIEKADEDLTQQKFQTLKKSIISKTLEPFNNLNDYFEFICRQINKGTFCFDRKTNVDKLNKILNEIKREDVINMLKQCIGYSIETWVVAQGHRKQFVEKGNIDHVKQIKQIRKNHQYYKDSALANQMSAQQ